MDLHNFFKNEVKASMGCTEPGAIAFAAASAASWLTSPLKTLSACVSLAMYKNARSVGIPGTNNLHGIALAACLGALGGNAQDGLLALQHLKTEHIKAAEAMLAAGQAEERVDPSRPPIWAEIILQSAEQEIRCTLQNRHDHIERITVNGQTVLDKPSQQTVLSSLDDLSQMNFAELWDLAGSIDSSLEKDLLAGAVMNLKYAPDLANTGDKNHALLDTPQEKTLREHKMAAPRNTLLLQIKLTAGAIAALRMSGEPIPIMSSAGSGNHGIVAIVPVAIVAQTLNASPQELAQALALSHLVCGFVKAYTGRMSPSCGCSVAAGAGAAAAIARLYGGTQKQCEQASLTLIAALLGMICDGAKASCAFKVSSAAGEAWFAAILALDEKGVRDVQGIIEMDLKSLGPTLQIFNQKILKQADELMVEIMTKQHSRP